MADNFQELLIHIEGKTGFPCQKYKTKPLMRRIRVRMRHLNLNSFNDYHVYLVQHPEELSNLLNTLTINLSYFFRNPETYDFVYRDIFPRLADRTSLNFWSAGCAHGEEAYSLAILAAEAGILTKTVIFGTDIDPDAINRAKAAEYPELALQYLPLELKKKYFIKMGDSYRLPEFIINKVHFLISDLFVPPPIPMCDLIFCRNVLIYLDRPAQSLIMSNLHQHLKPGGFLAIGKVELLLGVPEVKLFQLVNRVEHIYLKL